MSKGYYFDKKSKTFIIDKQFNGIRLYERTGLGLKDENSVKQIVAEKTVEIRKAQDKSQRPVVTFRECAYEYLKRNKSSKQIRRFAWQIQALDPFIGHVNAASIHQEHFAVKRIVADIESRGLKTRSIQSALEAIQRVLNAATQWRYDWCDLTWLESAPKFKMPKRKDAVPHAILTWDEQPLFLEHCAQHVADEVLVYVNTGLRDFELNSLKWEDELQLPNGLMGFIAKNKSDSQGNERTKLIVCNDIVREIIDRKRGESDEYVFTYNGNKKARSYNTAFKKARENSGVKVCIHGLRHTFGSRLREAGVSEETRAELLGHNVSLSTHYSAASIDELHKAVQSIMKPSKSTVIVNLNDYRKHA